MVKKEIKEIKKEEAEFLNEKEDLPGPKIYLCKSCNTKYTQEEAERVNYECCDEELENIESDPEHTGDDEI